MYPNHIRETADLDARACILLLVCMHRACILLLIWMHRACILLLIWMHRA